MQEFVYSNEEIQLNRKRAIYALRKTDESQRIAQSIHDERGNVCAIGLIGRELGFSLSGFNIYELVGNALDLPHDADEDEACIEMIYSLNDTGRDVDGTNEDGDVINFKYSWANIGDKLAEKLGIE